MRIKRISFSLVLVLLVCMLGIHYATATEVETPTKVSAILSCKVGDEVTLTVDGDECQWSSSNTELAEVKEDRVVVKQAGDCVVTNNDGFAVKLKAQGGGSYNHVNVNYDSNIEVKDVVIEDYTSSIKTVEINETLDNNSDSSPSSFKESEEGVVARSEGTYLLESSDGKAIVNVISPELNQYSILGATGTVDALEVITDGIETVATGSTDESVAIIDEKGTITLMGEGDCEVYIDTPNNRLTCDVTSIDPKVDESEVILKASPYEYQIEVTGNTANLPVKYEVIDGNGAVDDTGKVVLSANEECTVRITIWDKIVYEKHFKAESINEGYWEAMQPYIKECLGTPYLMGGNTPGVVLDCSAYVSYVYRMVGLVDGRYTAQGLYNKCQKIDNPQPGDMIFFKGTYNTPDLITHIGIYAGDGMMYHSGNPNQKASFETPYWREHFVGFGTMISRDTPNPKKSTSKSKGVDANADELDLMAAIIQCEAGTNYDGCLAVGSCIVNRINSPLYPNTISEVIYQSGQFEPTWSGRLDSVLAKGADDVCYQAARDALGGKNNIGKCLQFRAAYTGHSGLNVGGNVFFDER